MKKYKIICIDWKSIRSIKEAEKEKTELENSGYELQAESSTRLVYCKEVKPVFNDNLKVA